MASTPNTLTGHIPYIYEALDVVNREMIGLIPSVNLNAGSELVAKGQTIRSHVTGALPVIDIEPSVAVPDGGNQTIGYVDGSIDYERAVQVRFNGNEQIGLTSPRYAKIMTDSYAQAFRSLANEIEGVIAGLHTQASRAVGTAATNPFGASNYNHDIIAEALKVLKDNGAPGTDLQFVFDTAAGANMRKISNLYKVNEAGESSFLRQGVLSDIHGFALRESAAIKYHTKGTAANATTTNAGFAVGTTTIALASAGTGTIKAGDAITFAGDTNIYNVLTGDTDVSNGGSIVLQSPGLLQAIAASTTAITVVGSHRANIAFSRNAITLATRAPARPVEGDLAVDVMYITDPVSGITFEISQYAGHRQVNFFVGIAYGAWVSKADHLVKVLG